MSNMEPAAATADFESQPGVLPTATESQPDPFVLVEEPSQALPTSNEPMGRFRLSFIDVFCYFLADLVGVAAGTVRPRRGDKTPAKFDEFTVIKPTKGRPTKKRVQRSSLRSSSSSSSSSRWNMTTFLLLPSPASQLFLNSALPASSCLAMDQS